MSNLKISIYRKEEGKKRKARDSVYDEEDAGSSIWGFKGGEDGDEEETSFAPSSRLKRLMGDEDEEVDEWDEREGLRARGAGGERDATEARLAARDDDDQEDFNEPELEDEEELAANEIVEGGARVDLEFGRCFRFIPQVHKTILSP
jgi:hypothetical protein